MNTFCELVCQQLSENEQDGMPRNPPAAFQAKLSRTFAAIEEAKRAGASCRRPARADAHPHGRLNPRTSSPRGATSFFEAFAVAQSRPNCLTIRFLIECTVQAQI